MNQNVNPVTAAVIILASLLLMSLIFWARGESLLVGGPDQLQRDADDNLYIHIADKLYKLSPDMALLNVYDLPQLGVYNLVGDFAFFANGDMLVRLGKFEPGFTESVLRFFRVTETRQPVAKYENEGLYRCNLDTQTCIPFGKNNIDFDSAFHLSIDIGTDTVYLSDTGRHKLRKFNNQGDELAVQHQGYKFPNQLMLHNDKLLVADTNYHAVQVAETSDEKFGEIIDSHSVQHSTLGGDKWTYSFTRIEERWWVNNMSAAMRNGTVAIYNDKWQFIKAIDLPADADPIDIATIKNRVLITDLENIRLYQLDYEGNPLENALPNEVRVKLDQLQQDRMQYKNLSYFFTGLFILFLVVGFIVAIRQARNAEDPIRATASIPVHININDPSIKWIPVDKQKMRLIKIATVIPFLLLVILPFMFMSADKTPDAPPIVAGIFIIIVIPLITYHLFKIGVGSVGEVLVIKKSDKEFAAAKGQDIYYSDSHILIGDVYIPFNRQQLLFETEPVIKEIMPLLRDATYVKNGQMMNMILKRQKTWRIAGWFLLALVFIALLFSDIYG